MSTTINVVGTVATEPKLITPASGVQLCAFRLASDERRYDREQQAWVDGNTNWFGVVCFRGLATHANESFRTGDRVIVTGRLRVRKWEKDGKSGTAVEVEAEAIGHDIRWGVSRFEKRVGSQAADTSASRAEPQPAQEEQSESHDSTSILAASQASPPTSTNSQGEVSRDGFTPATAA